MAKTLLNSEKQPAVIVAPTSSGKTSVAVEICKVSQRVILSADSRQVYQELVVAAGKEGALKKVNVAGLGERAVREIEGVYQFGVDLVSLRERFTVFDYKIEAERLLSVLQPPPLIVGGTPLYVDAVAYDFALPKEDLELRKKLEASTNEELAALLREKDPYVSPEIFKTRRRLIRALETVLICGRPLREIRRRRRRSRLKFFGLLLPRDELYRRIDQRVDQAIACGLIEEVADLKRKGYTDELLMQCGLWVRLVLLYLRGELDFDGLREQLKFKTHEYARRQLSWWRRNPEILWLKESSALRDKLLDYLQQ